MSLGLILLIILLNGLIGFTQAWRADRALAALRRLASAHSVVLRNGSSRKKEATKTTIMSVPRIPRIHSNNFVRRLFL